MIRLNLTNFTEKPKKKQKKHELTEETYSLVS